MLSGKGSVRECLDHLRSKLNGAQFFAVGNLGKFFPPWTVPRDFWHAAIRRDVSGVAVDVKLFMKLGVGSSTGTGFTRTPFHTRHCGRGASAGSQIC